MKQFELAQVAGLFLVFAASAAHAGIFQWEYINPADPSQGKQQSTTLAPDGAGVDAVPGAYLAGRNLTMAYLIGADLTSASASLSDLTNADLSQANVSNAFFSGATLTGANFTGAEIRGARLDVIVAWQSLFGTGITLVQLYSTVTYEAHDLSGIGFVFNQLAGANFADFNLSNADFFGTTLTGANFSAANLTNANFHSAHLKGANFANANLTNTEFGGYYCHLGVCYWDT